MAPITTGASAAATRAPAFDPDDRAATSVPADRPESGLRYAGLTPTGPDDPCRAGYRIDSTDLCTHGPDPAPPGLKIDRGVPPIVSALAAPTVVCEGDGVTGRRVQVLYVRGAETESRFETYLESFRTWAAGVDAIYDASAQETGGSRRVRYVTEPDCTVNVLEVVVPATAINSFRDTIRALRDQGFNRTDRKYMLFADSDVYCGIGSFAGDDRPGENNRSNGGPSYGRTDSGCWSASVAAHEFGHNLGAVNDSAPNTSTAGHCLDEYDLMCYNDSSGLPTHVVCPARAHNQRLDCNHDDYYSTDPAPDSYLGTHWNTADNLFLIRPN